MRWSIVERYSSRSLDNFAALAEHLRNLLVLVRQQSESVSDVVPLPLVLGTRKAGSQLAGQLFGVLVL